MKHEDIRVRVLEFGKRAEVASEVFLPVVRDKRNRIIDELKVLYRESKADPTVMFSKIAVITELDDIHDKIVRSIEEMHRTDKEVIHGSATEPVPVEQPIKQYRSLGQS